MTSTPRLVSSESNALVKDLRRLVRDPGGYRRLGLIWLEGDHLAQAYLARGGRPRMAVLTEEAWSQPLGRAIAQAARETTLISAALMASCSSLESPATLGLLIEVPSARAQIDPHRASVVLDRLQDPGNVGSVLRSAAALGATQVIALKGTAALWSPKVLRAGMGAHFGLHLLESVLVDQLDALRVPLVATSSHAAHPLHEVVLPQPCAWVLGHEGQGVSGELAARCEITVGIPQPGGEESLNVAAAAAICLYESVRQSGRR